VGRRRWEEFTPALWPYIALFGALLERRMTMPEFETIFLAMYKSDPTPWPPAVFNTLETVFGAVDEYCEDDDLRREVDGLAEEDVRAEVERSLARLREMKDDEDRFAL
jgi:hypothetical protein